MYAVELHFLDWLAGACGDDPSLPFSALNLVLFCAVDDFWCQPLLLLAEISSVFNLLHQGRATAGRMNCYNWLIPNRNAPCLNSAAYNRYGIKRGHLREGKKENVLYCTVIKHLITFRSGNTSFLVPAAPHTC